jgi:HEAT repeat protein
MALIAAGMAELFCRTLSGVEEKDPVYMNIQKVDWNSVGPTRPRRRRRAGIALHLVVLILASTSLIHATETKPLEKAWNILGSSATDKGPLKRADAIKALGLLPHDPRARSMAEKALGDDNPDVRAAGATALGEMRSVGSIPKLTAALADKDPTVVLAAAHSLLSMQDQEAYDVYYAVLTGQRKGGRGLIAQQRAMLDDPKKLTEFGVETGLGFVPFGGLGVSAYKLVSKNGSDEVRAAAAQVLAKDPDPESRNALIEAISDHSYLVRIAALKALASRGDPRLLTQIEPSMDDQKDSVQCIAAAAVIRLSASSRPPRVRSDKNAKSE